MAQLRTTTTPKSKSKTSARTQSTSRGLQLPRTGLFTFLAAFAGVVAAVPLTIAAMMPMVHQDLASALSQADKRVVAVAPASDMLSCSQPSDSTTGAGASTSGSAGSGHVLGASVTTTPMGGGQGGGGSQQTPPPFVTGMIGGSMTSHGTISGTIGAGATATVSSTQTANTTVTNNNNFKVNSFNYQDTSSGDATSSYNTNGGTASTGDASSSNSTDISFDVKNN